MVVIVHTLESYLLYPQIYAMKLKMHPLLVLSALAIAEHFAGIRGLLLAVPVTLYAISNIIFDPSKAASGDDANGKINCAAHGQVVLEAK